MRSVRPLLYELDRSRQFAKLILRRGPVRLRGAVIIPRHRIGEVDGMQPIAGIAVALKAPKGREPDRRLIAVAMHE